MQRESSSEALAAWRTAVAGEGSERGVLWLVPTALGGDEHNNLFHKLIIVTPTGSSHIGSEQHLWTAERRQLRTAQSSRSTPRAQSLEREFNLLPSHPTFRCEPTMPTIAVDKAALFKELGREYVHVCLFAERVLILCSYRYTTEEFDELCFEFGMTHVRRKTLRFQQLTTHPRRN